jgi:hypothetical protein
MLLLENLYFFNIHRRCRRGNFFQRGVFYHGPGTATALICPVVDAIIPGEIELGNKGNSGSVPPC